MTDRFFTGVRDGAWFECGQRMIPPETFEEALERRRKQRHIVSMNEQDFRHGWNAAIAAAAAIVDHRHDPNEPWMCGDDLRPLEVEVQT